MYLLEFFAEMKQIIAKLRASTTVRLRPPSLLSDVRGVTDETTERFEKMLVTATEATYYITLTLRLVALTIAAVEKQKYYIF